MRYMITFSLVFGLAGCSQIQSMSSSIFGGTQQQRPVSEPVMMIPADPNRQQSVVISPTPVVAPPAQRAKLELPPAKKPQPVAQSLGTTVASLGNVAEPGFWLKTPLVSSRQRGKVTAANGQTVEVVLIPLGGPATGGSRMSLSAMQALGVSITDLPEVAVSPL